MNGFISSGIFMKTKFPLIFHIGRSRMRVGSRGDGDKNVSLLDSLLLYIRTNIASKAKAYLFMIFVHAAPSDFRGGDDTYSYRSISHFVAKVIVTTFPKEQSSQ